MSPEEVATLPFILYERKTVMRRLIDQFFAGIGVDPKIVMVMENIEAIKSLAWPYAALSPADYCPSRPRTGRCSPKTSA